MNSHLKELNCYESEAFCIIKLLAPSIASSYSQVQSKTHLNAFIFGLNFQSDLAEGEEVEHRDCATVSYITNLTNCALSLCCILYDVNEP